MVDHHSVIGIDLVHLFGREHRHIHQRGVVGEKGKVFEFVEFAPFLAAARRHAEQKVFGADAIFSRLIDARFIAGDHAQGEGCFVDLHPNALRSLVASQEVAHAMSGAVEIGDALAPHRSPRQHIELHTGGSFREHRPCQRQVPLQHEREIVFFGIGGITQADGARGIGGAFQILPSRVDEQQTLRRQSVSRLGRSLIVDDGSMVFVTRNHVEAIAAI